MRKPPSRRRLAALALLVLPLGAAACGTPSAYVHETHTGGYSEQRVSDDVWVVRFGGNGFTKAETVQAYWLYHCAEFAISKGYDGFEILSPLNLISDTGPATTDAPRLIQASNLQDYQDPTVYKPTMVARIRLLRKPVKFEPRHVFPAAPLIAALAPHVTGPGCDGNVCPHVHKYLYELPGV